VLTTHDASNYWNIELYDEQSGSIYTASTTWAIKPAASAFGGVVNSPNVLSGSTPEDQAVSLKVSKTGSPGNLNIYGCAYGRIVAT